MERVIIAGAGPSGLALACGLARYGVPTTLLERKHALDTHSRALVVWPRTLEIFRQWGIADALPADAQRRSAFELYAAENGRRLAGIDLSCIADQTDAAYALILPQDRTEQALLEAVQATGKTELFFDTEVTGWEERGDHVEVAAKRADGSAFSVRGAYLVGADGARGFVRGSIGYDLEGKTYPLRTLLADIRIEDERDLLPSPRLAVLAPYFGRHTVRRALLASDCGVSSGRGS